MKKQYTHVHNPIGNTWRTYLLKHWQGKRVTVFGKYGKIIESKHDKDMNFLYWHVQLISSREIVCLCDPGMSPAV